MAAFSNDAGDLWFEIHRPQEDQELTLGSDGTHHRFLRPGAWGADPRRLMYTRSARPREPRVLTCSGDRDAIRTR